VHWADEAGPSGPPAERQVVDDCSSATERDETDRGRHDVFASIVPLPERHAESQNLEHLMSMVAAIKKAMTEKRSIGQ
jgi:hypothetical protein